MKPVFTKTFFTFLFSFLIILGIAFGILLYSSSEVHKVNSVDNVALPK